MKTILITIAMVITGMVAQAQTDIIYPTKGEAMIFNCTIDKVKYGNIVHYTKNDSSAVVKAMSIIKDDVTINLVPMNIENSDVNHVSSDYTGTYKGQDYNYYNQLYIKHKHKAKKGRIWTFVGVGTTIGGVVLAATGSEAGVIAGAGLMTFGFFSFNIAVPSWAANAAKAKANKNAMEMIKTNKYTGPKEIAFGGTSNGVGLVISL